MQLELQRFLPSERYGYSCQTWLSRQANAFVHGNRFYCWFSTELNPFQNGDSSNPLWIYLTLDRAVKQDDRNNAKVKDVQANLMRGLATSMKREGRSNSEIALIIKTIRMAPLGDLRPQFWRVKLEDINEARYKGEYQYPNEFLIRDLRVGEFEVVVE